MNTKKMLGTAIGILLFAALIAGATFAWLTFGVTVGNNVFTGKTLNFVVNFEKGSAVKDLPILDSNYIEAKDAAVVSIVLKKNMEGQGENNPNGHASIWLKTTTDNNATKDGVVRWIICRDEDVETGDDLIDGKQVDDVCGNAVLMNGNVPVYADIDHNYNNGPLNYGIITGAGEIPLLSDARLSEGHFTGSSTVSGCATTNGLSMCEGTNMTGNMLKENGVSYFIYMWVEAEPLTNAHLDEQYDKKADGSIDYAGGVKRDLYSGYVFASATQLQQ